MFSEAADREMVHRAGPVLPPHPHAKACEGLAEEGGRVALVCRQVDSRARFAVEAPYKKLDSLEKLA